MEKTRRYAAALTVVFALTVSCGISRKTAREVSQEAPVILPLTDSTEITASRQRAREVLDSIDRIQHEPTDTLILPEEALVPEENKSLYDQVIDFARTFLGVPYRLGASGPDRFDCSGFTSYVFRHFGYNLPHYSVSQFRDYPRVESFSELQKGDLVFFGVRNSVRDIGHVGIITELDWEHGSFWFIHASVSHGVEIQRYTHPYFMMRYMGAVRILPDMEQ